MRHRDLGRTWTQVACRLHAVLCELIPGGVAKEITAGHAAQLLAAITPPMISMAGHNLPLLIAHVQRECRTGSLSLNTKVLRRRGCQVPDEDPDAPQLVIAARAIDAPGPAVRRAIPVVLGRRCLTPNWSFCARDVRRGIPDRGALFMVIGGGACAHPAGAVATGWRWC
jgi:hypothetical protein